MASNLAIMTLDEIKSNKCPVCQSKLGWKKVEECLMSNHCDRIFIATKTKIKSNDSYLWRVTTTYYEIL